MAVYRPKPPTPIWQPASAPANCKLYLPIAGGGGPLRDATRQSADLAVSGTAPYGRGEYGPHLACDGTTVVAQVADAPSNRFPGEATLAVLVRGASGQNNRGIVTKYVPFTGQRGYAIATESADGSGRVAWIYQADPSTFDSAQQLISIGSPMDGGWHVLVGTFRPSTRTEIWIDGRLDAFTTSNVPAAIGATTAALEVGRINGSFGSAFAGSVGAVALFGRALGQAEVRALSLDWLSGTFAAVRPRRSMAAKAAAAIPSAAPSAASLSSTLAGASLSLSANPAVGSTFAGTAGPASLALSHGTVNPGSFSGAAGPAALSLSASSAATTTVIPVAFRPKPPNVLPRRGHPAMAGKRAWVPAATAAIPPKNVASGIPAGLANSGASGVNPPTVVSGPWGPAIQFGSTSQQVQFPGGGYKAPPSQCTFHVVWRPDTTSTTPRLAHFSTDGKLMVQFQAVNGLQFVVGASAVASGFAPPTNGNWLGAVVAVDLVGKLASFWQYDYATGILLSNTGVSFTATAATGSDDTLAVNLDSTHSVRGAISDLGLGDGLWDARQALAYFRDPAAALRRPSMAPLLASALPPPKPVPFYHLFGSSYCGDI